MTPKPQLAGQKRRNKLMQELVVKAFERELSEALTQLESKFTAWRRHEINAFELNNEIHMHHTGISRDLWSTYSLKPETLLPLIIAKGVIKEEEVPSELLAEFKSIHDIQQSVMLRRQEQDQDAQEAEDNDTEE